MRRLIISAIIVAVAGVAGAATYYVDSEDGRDDSAWNGGPLEPWATLTFALSRASGENTFLCRGTFAEEVRVGEDDGSSEFVGNAEATLVGALFCENSYGAGLTSFRTYGFARGGAHAGLEVDACYFNYPAGSALVAGPASGDLRANYCVFEGCGYVVHQTFEFGFVRFSDCSISDCAGGISAGGELGLRIERSSFRRVTGTAVSFSLIDSLVIDGCEFNDCGRGVRTAGPFSPNMPQAYLRITGSVFRGNDIGLSLGRTPCSSDKLYVEENAIRGNDTNGLEVEGEFELRGNVVEDNGGHGVYVTRYRADLGTPGDPGGNTFAGNGSGYDVYNASPESIPAYGNTWDPRSEAEMEGKTWQEVNVTRIYDHWDDPSVGYVMWSEPMLGVAPASLGMIKGSFKDAPASGQAGPASKALGR
ncbi:MAG: right-handed parallel beta-helix repeat-containing protein [bacterium]